jgi:hypothetical protein
MIGGDLFLIPPIDLVFVLSALIFNLLITGIYLSERLGRHRLVYQFGIALLCLTIPFLIVFIAYLQDGASFWVIIVFLAIFGYMFLEWLWDYRLKIDFRSQPKLHIPYIILFYFVQFGFIAIAFFISDTWGWIISVSFWLLLGALVFSLIPRRKSGSGSPPGS